MTQQAACWLPICCYGGLGCATQCRSPNRAAYSTPCRSRGREKMSGNLEISLWNWGNLGLFLCHFCWLISGWLYWLFLILDLAMRVSDRFFAVLDMLLICDGFDLHFRWRISWCRHWKFKICTCRNRILTAIRDFPSSYSGRWRMKLEKRMKRWICETFSILFSTSCGHRSLTVLCI